MDSFIVAINVVFPLCLLILLGYLTKELKMVSVSSYKQVNKVVFKFLIPILLMKNIIETDISISFQPKLILYAVLCIFVLCSTLCIVIPKIEKDRKRAGSMIQAMYRSNFILFGLTLVGNMYGTDNVAVTSVLIAICVPLFNIISTIVLEYFGKETVSFGSLFKGVLSNPMVIGTIVGFTILLSGIQLPVFVKETIGDIGQMTTPLSLLVLGGTFEVPSLRNNFKSLTIVNLARLIIVPFVFVSIAIVLGYRNVELMSLLVLFGSPVAVSSYAMAVEMNCDENLASQAIVTTTIFSIISMILWIFGLNYLGMI